MIEVILPIRLLSEANQRGHWSKGARRAKDQRLIVGTVLGVSCRPFSTWTPRPHVRVTLTRIAPRGLDGDNLQRAFKAVRDGVADAIGVDDRDPSIEWVYAQRRGAVGGYQVGIRIDLL